MAEGAQQWTELIFLWLPGVLPDSGAGFYIQGLTTRWSDTGCIG